MSTEELRSYFDAYGASFLKTAADVAEFYNVPCITARQGAIRLNRTREDVESFFTDVLRRYREQGNVGGDIQRFEHAQLGANSIAVTVTWAYKDAAGKVLWVWTFTYSLYKASAGWKILLQTLHDSA